MCGFQWLTVVEFAGSLRHFKSQAHAEDGSLPPAHVFQQLQGIVVADVGACVSKPELSQIVGAFRSLQLCGTKAGGSNAPQLQAGRQTRQTLQLVAKRLLFPFSLAVPFR